MSITAIIPARKGSQRVQNKNIKKFGDTSLIEYKINNLKKVDNIDILISTDCEKVMDIAHNNGVSIDKRTGENAYYASSDCSASEFFKYLSTTANTDHVMYAPCTSPFIKPETINEIVDFYLHKMDKTKYDSIITVTTVKEYLWFKETETTKSSPINYDPENQPNSQNLNSVVFINYGCSILPRNLMEQRRNCVGSKPYMWELDKIEGFDIDYVHEFKTAELLYNEL